MSAALAVRGRISDSCVMTIADSHHPFDRRPRESFDRPSSRKWSMHPGTLGAWIAEADYGTAPVVREALRRAVDQEVLGYLATPLADELSAATADYHAVAYGWQVLPERIHHVSDVLAALRITTSFVAPGSPVVVPTPAYMPVLTLLPTLGHPVIEVPGAVVEGRWQHDLDAIEVAFAQGAQLLFLCNPHNPTGTVLSREELLAISEIVDRHGGRVFSDEIHAPLTLDGHRHIPYASVSETAAAHTVTSTSTSKAWNLPGLKAAQVLLSNDADHERWVREGLGDPFGASTLGVVAAATAYREGRPWLAEAREYLAENRDLFAQLLTEHAPRVSWLPNEATYLAWIDLGEERPDAAQRLLESGLAVTAGAACGSSCDRFVRFTYATPKPVLEQAARVIGTAL